METKLFEVRDRGTCMPSMAIRTSPANPAECWLLARMGYGSTGEDQARHVLFVPLCDQSLKYNPAEWRDRTRSTAHRYIIDHWDLLKSGQVIDVRHILGETDAPAVTDNPAAWHDNERGE